MKHKVYSRLPNGIEFRFYGNLPSHYEGGSDSEKEVTPLTDADRIVLNGTTEIVNHTLITHEGAMTLFDGDEHDVKKRVYSASDFERLKEHPLFKQMVKGGTLSIDVRDDLSRDMDGKIGMLSNEEIASRNHKDPDGEKVDMTAR